jgi:hypothetical protein
MLRQRELHVGVDLAQRDRARDCHEPNLTFNALEVCAQPTSISLQHVMSDTGPKGGCAT